MADLTTGLPVVLSEGEETIKDCLTYTPDLRVILFLSISYGFKYFLIMILEKLTCKLLTTIFQVEMAKLGQVSETQTVGAIEKINGSAEALIS